MKKIAILALGLFCMTSLAMAAPAKLPGKAAKPMMMKVKSVKKMHTKGAVMAPKAHAVSAAPAASAAK